MFKPIGKVMEMEDMEDGTQETMEHMVMVETTNNISSYNIGYQEDQSQAQSDYQTPNLSYNPSPGCCHSQTYTSGYEQGYWAQWTSLSQQQTNNQGINNRINIENSPGAQVNLYNGQSGNQGMR